MAPSLRRKNLVCFYCNTRSSIKYDGVITRWDCSQCESTNFLDENGDITDPPVATESAAPGLLKYASTESQPSRDPNSQLFCATCVKNQHLFTASLAQYHVETDPSHPRYKELEREYFTYRRNLEKLYPQVCEDCEPKVLERMRDAGRTAKADHLRRQMEKSRARRLNGPSYLSISGSFETIGKYLWYMGLVGQLLWSSILLSIALIGQSWLTMVYNGVFGSAWIGLEHTNALAWPSLLCSCASLWWNPMFKQMNKGFMNHISGLAEWYKLQVLSIVARSIWYQTMGTGLFTDPSSAMTLGANLFVLVFTSMLAIKSYRSLKVDLSPLWAATPEKIAHVGRKPTSPSQGLGSMADILDQITATPSRSSKNAVSAASLSPPALDLHVAKKAHQGSNFFSSTFETASTARNDERSSFSLRNISEQEPPRYMINGETPARPQEQYEEEMEWTPTESQSQHRAFNNRQFPQRISESFGHAPIAEEPSPFWYKVPPAPITPAQRLRNPPNRPALRVSSHEVKENFFNNVTQRSPVFGPLVGKSDSHEQEKSRTEIELAQQKFFPPPPPSEAGNTLVDLLTGFSLGSPENKVTAESTETRPWRRHIFQSLILLLGLLWWNPTVHSTSDYSQNGMLVIMLACAGIGMRTVLDGTTPAAGMQNGSWLKLGAVIGGLECGAAVYGTMEILAGRGHVDTCAFYGTVLLGEMLVHQLWNTSIGEYAAFGSFKFLE